MTRVKICGLKTINDVDKVNKYLPEYIGFVFANTRRFVLDEEAQAMKKALDSSIKAVGVFVDEPIEHVIDLCQKGIIDVAQLHGNEDEAYIDLLKSKVDTTVIKAVKVQNARQVVECICENADFMLFDTYKKGELGGTGERFCLDTLKEAIDMYEKDGKKIQPYFIAGGLSVDNIEEILGQVECFGVDVSTGVETDKIKDEDKIRNFIDKVRK